MIQVEIKLNEHEMICSHCNGIGCTHCCGQGKLDWIQNVAGVGPIRQIGLTYGMVYNKQFESVYNSKKIIKNRIGDIIKFDVTKEYFDKVIRKYVRGTNFQVPAYSRGEYAVIISIYRWLKYKYLKFNDYGRIIQMLTGSKKGHIRRYYITYPWVTITKKNKMYNQLKLDVDKLQLRITI